jgi:hypothetical protein
MSLTDGAAPAAASDGPLSFEQAVGILNTPPPKKDDEPATPEPAGAAEPESPPDGDDAGPDDPVPGEIEVEGDPADEPSIDPPRSWSKEHKDAFKALPAHLQQMVADSERAREADFLRRQNEAANKERAAEAREQAAEQARQQYEAILPAVYAELSGEFQRKFGHIKTQADVDALRANSPMDWMEFKDARETLWAKYNEAQAVQQRQSEQRAQNFHQYTASQDTMFMDKRPAFKDPKKASVLQTEITDMLKADYGFSDAELANAWNQGAYQTLRDHRWQLMITDALAYRKAKTAAKTAPRVPVPPVQRPGVAPQKGEAAVAAIKTLDDRLSRSGKLEDAVALLNARSKRRA